MVFHISAFNSGFKQKISLSGLLSYTDAQPHKAVMTDHQRIMAVWSTFLLPLAVPIVIKHRSEVSVEDK